MLLLTVLFAALAAWTLWRWWRINPDDNPLDARFPLVPLAVYGTLAALAYLPTLRADLAAARAGRAISVLEGRKLAYRCGSTLGVFFDRDTDMAVGYVRWTEDSIEQTAKLRHEVCEGLQRFLAAPNAVDANWRDKVIAIHVLAHEARHMLGERSEARAECQAIQRNALLARQLGASEDAARELALAYWRDIYPHAPPGYFSSDCRAGGALDEKLPSSPWNLAR